MFSSGAEIDQGKSIIFFEFYSHTRTEWKKITASSKSNDILYLNLGTALIFLISSHPKAGPLCFILHETLLYLPISNALTRYERDKYLCIRVSLGRARIFYKIWGIWFSQVWDHESPQSLVSFWERVRERVRVRTSRCRNTLWWKVLKNIANANLNMNWKTMG